MFVNDLNLTHLYIMRIKFYGTNVPNIMSEYMHDPSPETYTEKFPLYKLGPIYTRTIMNRQISDTLVSVRQCTDTRKNVISTLK